MARHAYRPTPDELTQAASIAWQLRGAVNVRITEHAAYAFGSDAWVCPNCLKPNYTVRSGKLPLVPVTCVRCRTKLM